MCIRDSNDPACAINDLLTLEQIGKFDAWEKTGVIPNEQLDYYKHNACPDVYKRQAMVMHLNFNRNCIRKLYDGEWET